VATRVELAPQVLDDFDHILDHAAALGQDDATTRIGRIVQAIDILATHPEFGRPVEDGHRELVIGRRPTGYVALYRYVQTIDTVFVLASRSQSERGYRGDE